MRRRWMLLIVVVTLLGGCGPVAGGPPGSGPSASGPPASSPGGNDLERLRQRARDALARYDKAFRSPSFVPVEPLFKQVGDWEAGNGDNKLALLSGRVRAAKTLPAAPRPAGTVIWDYGASQTIALISADEALKQLAAAGVAGAGGCPDCIPLEVTGARLSTTRIQTTLGPALVPAWEYTLRGTAVRVTGVAFSSSVVVEHTPPFFDPYSPPVGSATAITSGRQLIVTFGGAPGPRSQPCGADYSAEAVESAHAVVVIVIEHRNAARAACRSIGARRTTTVDLAQALGERAVLEVQQGRPVPLTIAG